jgi:hypothetical protein
MSEFIPHTKKCIGCHYWRYISGSRACHYFFDTGMLRLVDAENCDKWSTKTSERMIKRLQFAKRKGVYQ